MPLFLQRDDVIHYHEEQLRLSRGLPGIRDSDLLDSALAGPKQLFRYDGNADLFDIATAYAFHISQNQAFNDGNKRTGLQAAIAFLKGNGYAVETSEEHLFEWMLQLVQRQLSIANFSRKLCACSIREGGLTALIRRLFP